MQWAHSVKINILEASRERGSFKILPIDGDQAYRPIDLDRRQLGLAGEEGQIVNHGNMRKSVVTFEKQYMSHNGLAILCI